MLKGTMRNGWSRSWFQGIYVRILLAEVPYVSGEVLEVVHALHELLELVQELRAGLCFPPEADEHVDGARDSVPLAHREVRV